MIKFACGEDEIKSREIEGERTKRIQRKSGGVRCGARGIAVKKRARGERERESPSLPKSN